MYVCMYVCMYMYVCIYIGIYAHVYAAREHTHTRIFKTHLHISIYTFWQ